MPIHRILVGSHTDQIHLVEFDSSTPSLTVKHSLALRAQPSWIVLSPTHTGLCYVNGWVDDLFFAVRFDAGKGFEVLAQAKAGGGGPTHMEVTPDGKALISVNYRSGSIVYTPLSADGLFAQPAPSPNHVHAFVFPYSEVTHERQDGAHSHHLVALGDDWLVPDLGSDRVWRMRWEGNTADGKWTVVEEYERPQYEGPRHGVKHPDGKHLYIVNELAASVSVLSLPSSSSSPSSAALKTLASASVLPPDLRGAPRADPFDLTPSTILFLAPLPSAPADSPSTLLISNRNAPASLAPEGDTLALFSIAADAPAQLGEATFVHGAGRHLRGVAAGPPAGEEKERFVLVTGRDEGAMSVYERTEDGGLKCVLAHVLEEEEKPVSVLWLPAQE
ncbi:hypothetical protein JCM10450v2_007421 [Rhodotorula kratochvilovae]